MKRSTYIWSIIPLTFLWLLAAHAAGRESSALAELQVVEAYGHLPLSFEANQGQTDQRVRFLVRGNGYSLFLTANEAVLALRKKTGVTSQKSVAPPASAGVPQAANFPLSFRSNAAELNANSAALNGERQAPGVLRMRLVGANAAAKVTGLEELPGKSNYFIGNDPGKWRTNVPNYAMVKYADVYPGVDLVYYGNKGQLEYDFVVEPGADPNFIRLAINSNEQLGSRQKAAGSENEAQNREFQSQSAINRKSSMAAPLQQTMDKRLGIEDKGRRTSIWLTATTSSKATK